MSIDQSMTRRLNMSSTTAQYTLRLPSGMFCDIGNPQQVRFEAGEVSVKQVRRGCLPGGSAVWAVGSQYDQQGRLLHRHRHSVVSDRDPMTYPEFGVHPQRSIGAA